MSINNSVFHFCTSPPPILAPNFVSSITKGDFVYFFFRETAVEYINCGKVSIILLKIFESVECISQIHFIPSTLFWEFIRNEIIFSANFDDFVSICKFILVFCLNLVKT